MDALNNLFNQYSSVVVAILACLVLLFFVRFYVSIFQSLSNFFTKKMFGNKYD